MSEKQTCCPQCHTIYKVTLSQLTIAQGQVCCPKCALTFNALAYLVPQEDSSAPQHLNSSDPSKYSSLSTSTYEDKPSLAIFDRRITNSNINLLTYLNNLNYFKSSTLTSFPQLNLADQQDQSNKNNKSRFKKHSFRYYLIWGLIDIYLICIFIFQVLWFNPNLIEKSPLFSTMFHHICNALNCKVADDRSNLLNVGNIRIQTLESGKTQFSGFIVNYHDKSLQFPLLKLTLKNKQQQNSFVLKPKDYLNKELANVQHIAKNHPYPFKFIINRPRESVGHYSLEIIYP